MTIMALKVEKNIFSGPEISGTEKLAQIDVQIDG